MRMTLSNGSQVQLKIHHQTTHDSWGMRYTKAEMFLDNTVSGAYAFCHESDRFVKKKGTALAVSRVLSYLLPGHENKPLRTEIWNKLWNKKPNQVEKDILEALTEFTEKLNENQTNLQDS